ncbi:MAG TPA: anhydro-N-acetylmuramic acid kinase [Aggregatilineales bacterium]|nr:anhydro-N-acetylmuramic acid kinase [Anaerolineales bacterium]HRE49035.1 anhydro-N-acetylmuramic acid kinase [Aggregatilineales bacterium]
MRIVGLMSGTSADGIDAALCEISGTPPRLSAMIRHALTIPYPADLRSAVLAAYAPGRIDALCELNVAVGEAFAAAALAVIAAAGITPEAVDLIGSHGQTVWHAVREDGTVSATLQIGEASVIAERTGITTVANFRPRDVAAGGQGAPLTGYADWLLLRHPTHWRAAQNIGGIGNVTFLPPLSDTQSDPLAFDTGPGNALIDSLVTTITAGAQGYDLDGHIAASGRIDEEWLAALLTHPYFSRRPPKTTGRELFSAALAAAWRSEGRERGLSDADVIATLTKLTAASITNAYQRFAPAPLGEVILGGGGTRNPVLVAHLRTLLGDIPLHTHEHIGLDSDNKEALVFALLAHETWHARSGTHPALTGAHHATVLGQITPGRNYSDLIQRTWSAPTTA